MPENRRDGTDSAPSGSIPNETWSLAGISLAISSFKRLDSILSQNKTEEDLPETLDPTSAALLRAKFIRIEKFLSRAVQEIKHGPQGLHIVKAVTEAKMPIEEFLTQPAIESNLGNISDTSDRARTILRHRSTITNSQRVSKKTFGGVPKLWKELNPLMSYLEEWNRGLE
jgi:hypothetical protein